MSYDMTFRGQLQFRTKKALAEALADIDDDCWEDSALARDDLACRGATLEVDWDGSAPASTWEGALHVLETLAEAAESGEIVATYDGGEGPDNVLTERIGPDNDDDADAEAESTPSPEA